MSKNALLDLSVVVHCPGSREYGEQLRQELRRHIKAVVLLEKADRIDDLNKGITFRFSDRIHASVRLSVGRTHTVSNGTIRVEKFGAYDVRFYPRPQRLGFPNYYLLGFPPFRLWGDDERYIISPEAIGKIVDALAKRLAQQKLKLLGKKLDVA